MGKTIKIHLSLKSKKSILFVITIIQIIIVGFILGALSGKTDNLNETQKLALIIPLCLLPVLLLSSIQIPDPVGKYLRAFFILAIVIFGIVEVSLTKPDVDLKAQILGFLALIFVGFNWIFITFKMCDMCEK
jgi:hypothetical protein